MSRSLGLPFPFVQRTQGSTRPNRHEHAYMSCPSGRVSALGYDASAPLGLILVLLNILLIHRGCGMRTQDDTQAPLRALRQPQFTPTLSLSTPIIGPSSIPTLILSLLS